METTHTVTHPSTLCGVQKRTILNNVTFGNFTTKRTDLRISFPTCVNHFLVWFLSCCAINPTSISEVTEICFWDAWRKKCVLSSDTRLKERKRRKKERKKERGERKKRMWITSRSLSAEKNPSSNISLQIRFYLTSFLFSHTSQQRRARKRSVVTSGGTFEESGHWSGLQTLRRMAQNISTVTLNPKSRILRNISSLSLNLILPL